MISEGNTKLGKIPNWSLSPKRTCPGKTPACEKACYVERYTNRYTSAKEAYEKNTDAVLLADDWTVEIRAFLAKKKPANFRIHVSGDFFSPKYIQEWGSIIKEFPQTQFLAYTRSWRLKRLRTELNRLRELPNMVMFASCDQDAFDAPAGWKTAWMGTPLKGSATFCPGYGPKELECAACKLCFKLGSPNIHFPLH